MVRLTDRQLQILRLMVEGLPDKAVAARLSISVRCVRLHVATACRRLGCSNRIQLTARALVLGVIVLEGRQPFIESDVAPLTPLSRDGIADGSSARAMPDDQTMKSEAEVV